MTHHERVYSGFSTEYVADEQEKKPMYTKGAGSGLSEMALADIGQRGTERKSL